eukprot:NODE_157_length_16664_cov_0.301781.p12 type:complete len:127 gc:universal NODE_157_length_16664_cov_0.301781:1958-1578(-)
MIISRKLRENSFLSTALAINTLGFFICLISSFFSTLQWILVFVGLVLIHSAVHFFVCLILLASGQVRDARVPLRIWSAAIFFNSNLAFVFSLARQEEAAYATAFGFLLLSLSQSLHLYHSFNKSIK